MKYSSNCVTLQTVCTLSWGKLFVQLRSPHFSDEILSLGLSWFTIILQKYNLLKIFFVMNQDCYKYKLTNDQIPFVIFKVIKLPHLVIQGISLNSCQMSLYKAVWTERAESLSLSFHSSPTWCCRDKMCLISPPHDALVNHVIHTAQYYLYTILH